MAIGKKFGGRQVGVGNHDTAKIKEAFTLLVSDNMVLLNEDLKSLTPFERLKIVLELAKFIIPTLKSVDANVQTNEGINMINLGMGTIPDIGGRITPEEIKIINENLEKYY